MKQIIFNSKGTTLGKQYTREEVVRLLSEFQDEMIRDYRSRFNGTLFNRKYFSKSLKSTADEYKLRNDAAFYELRKDADQISMIISTLKSGLSGETRAMKAISWTLPGEEIIALYGITLQEGKECTEYDAIVITPNGVFAIEVKSYSQDMTWDEKGLMRLTSDGTIRKNLGERMNCKEFLLRKKLQAYKDVPFYNILLVADNRSQITDHYKRVPISYLNTIMGDIRSHNDGTRILSREQMDDIKQILSEYDNPVLTPCPIDCEKVLNDYSLFVEKCAYNSNRSIWKRICNLFGRKEERENGLGIA